MRLVGATIVFAIGTLAPFSDASDDFANVQEATVTASGRIVRRESTEQQQRTLHEERRTAAISAHGVITEEHSDLGTFSAFELGSMLRLDMFARGVSPPGLIGGAAGATSASGEHTSAGDVMDDVHKSCADGPKSGRIPRSYEGGASSATETCQEMMFSARHLRVNTCWDRRDGPGIRDNCKRTCGCCCPNELGSGTHDSNGIEVTCRQLVQWTGLYKYDYCADPTYGGAIRSKCKSLCCTCTPAMEWLAGYSYGNGTHAQGAGDRGPQPLIELTDDINEARRLVSELAESVDSIAGELPKLGVLVVGRHDGGSSSSPPPAPFTVPQAGSQGAGVRDHGERSLESKVEDEYKDQWGAAVEPPPEQGVPSANETDSKTWVTSPKYWSPTAQSEAAATATMNASDVQVPPPERAGAAAVASAAPSSTTWRDDPDRSAVHKAAATASAHGASHVKSEVAPFGSDSAVATQDLSGTDGKTSASVAPPFTPAQKEPDLGAIHKAAATASAHGASHVKREVAPFGSHSAVATQDLSGTDGKTSASAGPPFTPAQKMQ